MFRLLTLVAVGGVATAAPVPKIAPPPAPKTNATLTLGTATLNGQTLRISYEAPGVAPPVPGAGVPAVRPLGVRGMNVSLSTVRVTTTDGTELTGDDLAKRLEENPAVVRSVAPLDPEWKKLFADVLFVEPNGKAANPFGGAAGGAVVLPAIPPVEKK
jgi:hypothetical protein